MRNNYLNDKDLLKIYGINNPNKNLGNKYAQIRAIQDIKFKNQSQHLIKNPYVRWAVILIAIALGTWLGVWLFNDFSDGLLSWQRV